MKLRKGRSAGYYFWLYPFSFKEWRSAGYFELSPFPLG